MPDTTKWVRQRDSLFPLTIQLPKDLPFVRFPDAPTFPTWVNDHAMMMRASPPGAARRSFYNESVSEPSASDPATSSCEIRVEGRRAILEAREQGEPAPARQRYLFSASWEVRPGYWLNYFGFADSAELRDALLGAQYTVRFDPEPRGTDPAPGRRRPPRRLGAGRSRPGGAP